MPKSKGDRATYKRIVAEAMRFCDKIEDKYTDEQCRDIAQFISYYFNPK